MEALKSMISSRVENRTVLEVSFLLMAMKNDNILMVARSESSFWQHVTPSSCPTAIINEDRPIISHEWIFTKSQQYCSNVLGVLKKIQEDLRALTVKKVHKMHKEIETDSRPKQNQVMAVALEIKN